MSMHKTPLTDFERNGLRAHGLPRATPSQLSDCFRLGVAWAQQRIAELEREVEMHKAAEEAQIALRQKADEREAALAAHVESIRYVLVDAKRCVAVVAHPSIYRAPQYQPLAKRVMQRIESIGKRCEFGSTSL